MKTYKALVRDSEGNLSIITFEHQNIKSARRDITNNGYTLVKGRIKEASEFDRIVNETNSQSWDWHPRKYSYRRR